MMNERSEIVFRFETNGDSFDMQGIAVTAQSISEYASDLGYRRTRKRTYTFNSGVDTFCKNKYKNNCKSISCIDRTDPRNILPYQFIG